MGVGRPVSEPLWGTSANRLWEPDVSPVIAARLINLCLLRIGGAKVIARNAHLDMPTDIGIHAWNHCLLLRTIRGRLKYYLRRKY